MYSGAYEYEPLLYDRWLDEISAQLDRLLAYRREMQELEISAVKVAADYQLWSKRNLLDLELEKMRLNIAEINIKQETQINAAKEFNSAHELAQGFHALSSGAVKEIDAELKSLSEQKKILEEQYELNKYFQDLFFSRTKSPGNAHNYAERADFVRILLNQDALDCYKKATAIDAGIRQIYGEENPLLPKFSSAAFINELIFWCRTIMAQQNFRKQWEVEFNIIIPLVQVASPLLSSLVSEKDFVSVRDANVSGPAELYFTIPDGVFGDRSVRLLGVGVSFGSTPKIQDSGTDKSNTILSYVKHRVCLVPPVQKIQDITNVRPNIILGEVSVYGGEGGPCFSNGQECRNLDPIGDWVISVERNPAYKDIAKISLKSGIMGEVINDIKLHFKVRTIATTPPKNHG